MTAAPVEPVTSTAIVPVAAPQRTLDHLSQDSGSGSIAAFSSERHFVAAQRMAKMLCSSTMVPKDYQGENNIGNCLVAMELAGRIGASVMAVMQNVHIIQGRPSWASVFLIGSVNSCGRFTALRYEVEGGDDPKAKGYRVRAYATEKATGEKLVGEWITWGMVDGEGWSKKQGSKWLTMPGQMFRYRAAAFWTRSYAPEISLGMHAADEVEDMRPEQVSAIATVVPPTGADKLRALVASPALEVAGVVINDAPIEKPVENPDEQPEREAEPAEETVVEVEPPETEERSAANEVPDDIKQLRMRRDARKTLTPNEKARLDKYENSRVPE